MQYVSRNPLIPTIQNLSRFTETLRVIGTSNLTKSDDNIKLLRDRDTLNAFLTDIQHLLNESNYNTKNAIINDVKDILESLKVLSINTNNNDAKKTLQKAFEEISVHIHVSSNLSKIISDIENNQVSEQYIEEIFKTLDKSTIYNKQAKTINNVITNVFSKSNKKSLAHKTIKSLNDKYVNTIKNFNNINNKLLSTTKRVCTTLKTISVSFRKFLSTTWKSITKSIKFVSKKLVALSRSLSTIVLGIFKLMFNVLVGITKTLISITSALTSFLSKNILGIISGVMSGVWSFLTTPTGIKTLTFITGYIYGRYLKGKILPYIKSLINAFDKNSITEALKKKFSDFANSIIKDITENKFFNYTKIVAENIIDGIHDTADKLKIGVNNVMNFVSAVNQTAKDIFEPINELAGPMTTLAAKIANPENFVGSLTRIASGAMAGSVFGPIGAVVGAGIAAAVEGVSVLANNHLKNLETVNYVRQRAYIDQAIQYQNLLEQIGADNRDINTYYAKITSFGQNLISTLSKGEIEKIVKPTASSSDSSATPSTVLKEKYLNDVNATLEDPEKTGNYSKSASAMGTRTLLNSITDDSNLSKIHLLHNAAAKEKFATGYMSQLRTNQLTALTSLSTSHNAKNIHVSHDTIFNNAMTSTFGDTGMPLSISQITSKNEGTLIDNLRTQYAKELNVDATNPEVKEHLTALAISELEKRKFQSTEIDYADQQYDAAVDELTRHTGQATPQAQSLGQLFDLSPASESENIELMADSDAQLANCPTMVADVVTGGIKECFGPMAGDLNGMFAAMSIQPDDLTSDMPIQYSTNDTSELPNPLAVQAETCMLC